MWQSIRNFASRHRKKLIFGGLVTGGAVYVWKVLLPRWQDAAVQSLLQSLQELAGEKEGGDASGAQDEELETLQKKAKFEHLQQVCDAHSPPRLAALRAQHYAQFAVEECTENIKKAEGRENKMTALRSLQVEVLARETSLLTAMHAVLLLRRIMFNIAGRALAGEDRPSGSTEGGNLEETSLFAFFLDLSIQSTEAHSCLVAFTEAAKKVVESKCDELSLMPTTQVQAEMLTTFFLDVCTEMRNVLLSGSACVDILLPEWLDLQDAPDPAKVTELLNEAKDYLESPQFTQVQHALVQASVTSLVEALKDANADIDCPLAKLMGKLMNSTKDEAAYVERLSSEALVQQLCEDIYFSTSSSEGVDRIEKNAAKEDA
mmetsp:Transcript_42263/g.95080  ORF Transcript_42263/g.95080 Transcript_42263/m.95080 type:complete len:375 (-) Transcript_42263:23-1147(-)